MKVQWLLVGMLWLAQYELLAATVDAQFTPRTTIIKNTVSDEIMIVAENTDQQTYYNKFSKTFEFVTFPFRIQAKAAEDILKTNYSITLFYSEHSCQENNIVTPLNGVRVDLNQDELLLNQPQYFTPDWLSHRLFIHFPEILQGEFEKNCQGKVAIQVEATGI